MATLIEFLPGSPITVHFAAKPEGDNTNLYDFSTKDVKSELRRRIKGVLLDTLTPYITLTDGETTYEDVEGQTAEYNVKLDIPASITIDWDFAIAHTDILIGDDPTKFWDWCTRVSFKNAQGYTNA